MNKNEKLQSRFPDWLTEDYKLMESVSAARSFGNIPCATSGGGSTRWTGWQRTRAA